MIWDLMRCESDGEQRGFAQRKWAGQKQGFIDLDLMHDLF